MLRPRVPPSPALTPQEKAQLKEKLASLKREYSRTFHRLQRAERAEKAKNSAKKSVAEDSLLLLEEGAENSFFFADSTSQASEKVCVAAGPEASATKAPSPIFKPETFSQGDGLPENLGSTLPIPEHEGAIFSPLGSGSERRQNLWTRRKRTSSQQRITLAGVEKPACNAIQKNAGCLPGSPASSVEGSRSPVFKRNSFLEPDHPIPKPSFEGPCDGRHSYESPIAESQPRCLQMTEEAPECIQEENGVPVLETSGAKGVTLDKGAGMEMAEDVSRAADLASSSPLQGRRAAICECKVETHYGRNQGEVSQNVDLGSLDTMGKKPGEQDRTKSSLPEGDPAASTDSVLSSCTVVEGLPFPVEYYVRTTRRMSTCQREVNVAAVIQNQLGKKAKGRRASQKKGADPASPCQRLAAASGPPPNANGGETGSVVASPELLPLTGEGPSSDKRLSCQSGLLPRQKGRLRRRLKGSQAPSGTFQAPQVNLELTAPEASACQVSGEAHVYDEAEPQTVQSSGELNLEAESPASFVGGLEGDHQRPCPEAENENHARNEWMQLDNGPSPLPESSLASLEWRDRGTLPGSEQGRPTAGSQGPASINLPGTQSAAFPLHVKAKETAGLKGQPSHLDHEELHVSEDGFGVLKSEKLRTGKAGLPLETFDPGDLTASFERAGLLGGEIHLKETVSALPPLAQRGLSSSKLLLSPAPEGLSCAAESQLLTPAFPLVGATPASEALLQNKVLPEESCSCSLEGKPDPRAEQEDLANAPDLQEEDAPGTTVLQSQGQDGMHWEPEMDVGSPTGSLLPPGNAVGRHKGSIEQGETTVEDETKVPGDCGREGSLRLASKLKSFSGSCSVDASTVWWETECSKELCVLTASETSVTLWRQLDTGQWGALHTWLFAKVPVIQLVPLPDVSSLACVALGAVEIAEMQFLFQSSEDGSAKQSLVKAGNIKAVLGLRDRRLVSSCGSLKQQEVELVSFSGAGRSNEKAALTPPEEAVIAFAEVEGKQEALLGMTAINCVVIWNLKTGQLLQKMPISCSSPASLCHKAYSESGLLFVIVGHPHAKESKSCGNPVFQLFAFNPKTARSAGVSFLTLPLGAAGRYLEGEVWDTSAAAVLTSGTVVVWDLFLGRCTALLPPSPEGSWSHVRWSVTGSSLLAGQKDGSVYIYDYAAGPRPA